MTKLSPDHPSTTCSRFACRSVLLVFALGGALHASAAAITVGTALELQSAINTANSNGGGYSIILRDGTYTLSDTLYINTPNVSISSQSGDRSKVIIQGDAMSSSARVGNVIRVAASNFELSGVTLQKSGWHLIQIAGESNADFPLIRNCVLRDAYEQMIKVSMDTTKPSITSDNGVVENCVFEYSAGIGPQYYIGGIDAHGAKNWVIRGNTFRNIISPDSAVAEFAVHFWNGSADNIVERNTIVNCDRGIGFGMDGRPNSRGIIRNNMIYHAADAGAFADAAIVLTESPDSQIYNNSVYMEHSFPWAIEYRWQTTENVLIANNLTNKAVTSRDGATAVLATNITNSDKAWFVSASTGDLHLASRIDSVVGEGQQVDGLFDDFDGQPRLAALGIDVGADQIVDTESALPAPTAVRILQP